MTRPGYNPYAQEHRQCPRCRYPMLRAEKLGGVSDMVGVPDPSASWLTDTFYALALGLLVNALVAMMLVGTLNLYRLTAGLPNELVAYGLLTLEGLTFWTLRQRLWLGWKNLWAVWYTAARNSRDDWHGDSLWTQRRNFGKGGGWGAGGFLFASLCSLPAFQWVIRLLPSRLTLSTLAVFSIIVAMIFGFFLVPEVLARSNESRIYFRQQRRQKLMRELLPEEWACPNCLYAEKAR